MLLWCYVFYFCYYWYPALLDVHSFPTRRSSDLVDDRLVEVRVELLADGLDRRHALGLQDVAQLAFGELHALDPGDRKSTRLNSSHLVISYAVFCLKKKKNSCYHDSGLFSVILFW